MQLQVPGTVTGVTVTEFMLDLGQGAVQLQVLGTVTGVIVIM